MGELQVDPKVDRALAPLRAGLEADKVQLVPEEVRDAGKTLVLRLQAAPDACADCVVGTEVMEAMALDALVAVGAPYEAVSVRSDPPPALQ